MEEKECKRPVKKLSLLLEPFGITIERVPRSLSRLDINSSMFLLGWWESRSICILSVFPSDPWYGNDCLFKYCS